MASLEPGNAPAIDALSALKIALDRSYLSLMPPTSLATAPDVRGGYHWLELLRFATAEGARVRERTISLLAAMAAAKIELALRVHGDGHRLRFFIGRIHGAGDPTAENQTLTDAIHGYFADIPIRAANTVAHAPPSLNQRKHLVAIVGIPSERAETPQESRLDEAYNAIARLRFDLVVTARPLGVDACELAASRLAQVSDFARTVAGTSVTDEIADRFSESYQQAYSLGESFAETTRTSEHVSERTSKTTADRRDRAGIAGAAFGGVLGGVAGFVAGGPPGAALGCQLGSAIVGGAVRAAIPAGSATSERSSATERAFGNERRSSSDVTSSNTTGRDAQRTLRATFQIAATQAESLAKIASRHLDRLERGRGLGLYRVAVHVAADERIVAHRAAHVLIGALSGDGSHLGPFAVIEFADESAALARLARGQQLDVAERAHPIIPGGEQLETWLRSDELAFWMRPPSSPIATLDVRTPARFATFVGDAGDDSLELGALVSGERTLGAVEIRLNDLTRHAFVAGTTGSGKTNTIKFLLSQLDDQKIPFMLIEPAKSEYRDLFDALVRKGRNPLRLVTRKPATERERVLTLNPLRAPVGVPLFRHLEAVKGLLLGSFDLGEGLPQAMERLLFRPFEGKRFRTEAGLRARLSYPTLASLARKRTQHPRTSIIDDVIDELGYDERATQIYKAALKLRIESFSRGSKAALFDDDVIPFNELLTRPVFVDLRDLTDSDVRRFFVGALLIRLYGEREAAHLDSEGEPKLKHLVVLEEAHHFLREDAGGSHAARLARQSNELLANAFAELRSYGQGILVADQAPAELSPAVLRNTATKIVHTLFHEADCNAVGDAIGLDDEHRSDLRRLRTGEAIVLSPSIPSAVMCRIRKAVHP